MKIAPPPFVAVTSLLLQRLAESIVVLDGRFC